MIQSRFIIELERDFGSLTGFHRILLSKTSKALESSGIECSSIQKKCTTLYYIAAKDKEKCSIQIYESYSINSDSKIKCYMVCSNSISFWKKVINRCSEEDYFSGNLLENIINRTCIFLRNDPRIANFILVDKEQFIDSLKNAKESYFF